MDTVTDPRITNLLRWAGLQISGDFGPWTCYTTHRFKRVFYPRSPPTKPPSVAQRRCRDRFGFAVTSFKALAPATQAAWEALSKQLNLSVSGINLWIHLSTNEDRDSWNTAVTRTGTTLTPPSFLPR